MLESKINERKKKFYLLSFQEEEAILKHIRQGKTNYFIMNLHNISVARVEELRGKVVEQLGVHFGYKDQEYLTENEMISGFSCDYNSLSEIEKNIYDLR